MDHASVLSSFTLSFQMEMELPWKRFHEMKKTKENYQCTNMNNSRGMTDDWLRTMTNADTWSEFQQSVCPRALVQALVHWTLALTSFSIVQQAIISGHSFCEMQHWILFEPFVHICHISRHKRAEQTIMFYN